jgi:hypothetical protein
LASNTNGERFLFISTRIFIFDALAWFSLIPVQQVIEIVERSISFIEPEKYTAATAIG